MTMKVRYSSLRDKRFSCENSNFFAANEQVPIENAREPKKLSGRAKKVRPLSHQCQKQFAKLIRARAHLAKMEDVELDDFEERYDFEDVGLDDLDGSVELHKVELSDLTTNSEELHKLASSAAKIFQKDPKQGDLLGQEIESFAVSPSAWSEHTLTAFSARNKLVSVKTKQNYRPVMYFYSEPRMSYFLTASILPEMCIFSATNKIFSGRKHERFEGSIIVSFGRFFHGRLVSRTSLQISA